MYNRVKTYKSKMQNYLDTLDNFRLSYRTLQKDEDALSWYLSMLAFVTKLRDETATLERELKAKVNELQTRIKSK